MEGNQAEFAVAVEEGDEVSLRRDGAGVDVVMGASFVLDLEETVEGLGVEGGEGISERADEGPFTSLASASFGAWRGCAQNVRVSFRRVPCSGRGNPFGIESLRKT